MEQAASDILIFPAEPRAPRLRRARQRRLATLAPVAPASLITSREALCAINAACSIATGCYGVALSIADDALLLGRCQHPHGPQPGQGTPLLLVACHHPYLTHCGLQVRLSRRTLEEIETRPDGPERAVALAHGIVHITQALDAEKRRSGSLVAFYDASADEHLRIERQPHTRLTCVADVARPEPPNVLERMVGWLLG